VTGEWCVVLKTCNAVAQGEPHATLAVGGERGDATGDAATEMREDSCGRAVGLQSIIVERAEVTAISPSDRKAAAMTGLSGKFSRKAEEGMPRSRLTRAPTGRGRAR